MNRKLLKALTFLLIFIALILSSTSSTATTKSDYKTTFSVSGSFVNPILNDTTYIPAKVFSSSQETDETTPVYTSSKTEIAESIRTTMENRTNTITVYYSEELSTSNAEALDLYYQDSIDGTIDNTENEAIVNAFFKNLTSEFLELSFTETGIATQGDYLRYSWSGFYYNIAFAKTDDIYNFNIALSFSYFTTKAQETELSEAIDDLIISFNFDTNTTDRKKIDTIYTYITNNISYDYEHLENEADTGYQLHYTAYAALMNKTAVCEGYAVLFYRLAEMCGIDSRVITGSTTNSRDESHAWNIVKLDDYYYYVDPTWDAEQKKYGYYLKGSSDFIGHVNDSTFDSTDFTTTYPISLTRTYNNK